MADDKVDLDDVLGLAASETDHSMPAAEAVTNLTAVVRNLIKRREQIKIAEEELKEMKRQERSISEETIPSLMDEMGVQEIKTDAGFKVRTQPYYSGKIIEEHEDKAFEWLELNGHGGVIKGEAILPFSREERDEMLRLLDELDWGYKLKLGVHHSTLRALFRTLVEDEGTVPPPDLFNLFMGRKTVIKES